MRSEVMILLLIFAGVAGCLTDDADSGQDLGAPLTLPREMAVQVSANATVTESLVTPAVYLGDGLYEPTIDVSPEGTIYIAGHTFLVDTTGAPAYVSNDDGASWQQLPFAGEAEAPSPAQTGSPPPSDEIFIVAGDDGWAYGVDITAATFPLTFWSGDGTEMAYHNPNAYSRSDQAEQACEPVSLNDRPWAAYANDTLLMVNNPGTGRAQIAVMEVPPGLPGGAPGNPATGPTWNTCAGPTGVYIPGIPDLRDDGLFAVPHRIDADTARNQTLAIILGNTDDIFDLNVSHAFTYNGTGGVVSNYGQAVFDDDGHLFVGLVNNSYSEVTGKITQGNFDLAVSTDDGATFRDRTLTVGDPAVESLYLDGNKYGPGALAVWSTAGSEEGRADWYIGHVQIGADGAPVLENVALVIDEGPRSSPHVTGAAAGPDGRAYLAMFDLETVDAGVISRGTPGQTPLSVWIQQDGPTLPGNATSG